MLDDTTNNKVVSCYVDTSGNGYLRIKGYATIAANALVTIKACKFYKAIK